MRQRIRRLYRGDTRVNFIGNRQRWYLASAIMIAICLLSIGIRGFNYGVEFAGGNQFQIPVTGSSITTSQVNQAFSAAGTSPDTPAQAVGSGSTHQIVVKTGVLSTEKQQALLDKVASILHLSPNQITTQSVSSSWGHDITVKAIEGLIIFLVVVSIYISIRFQWRMAVGGILALIHDLFIAAGIYSLVGFEVNPSTVVGLLTILGFSLYDTVVVYDKVAENSKDLLAGSRMTYSEAANLAVNQTLMRSINTSLIALLPVAGLLFVGAGILGVGTIKDLALILFVGLASGAYSSLFLATPIVVDLTEAEPEYRALAKRVAAKRASEAAKGATARPGEAALVAAGPVLAPSGATRKSGG
ncbi:MAG: protein translocase subunit SecF, partial [Actinomycetota bacterium]|nr:protein translocase subunit SecF [Actinomycetota bacterium]